LLKNGQKTIKISLQLILHTVHAKPMYNIYWDSRGAVHVQNVSELIAKQFVLLLVMGNPHQIGKTRHWLGLTVQPPTLDPKTMVHFLGSRWPGKFYWSMFQPQSGHMTSKFGLQPNPRLYVTITMNPNSAKKCQIRWATGCKWDIRCWCQCDCQYQMYEHIAMQTCRTYSYAD
jgi:hypothetical protein